MAAPDKTALDALLEAHLSNLKSHQAMMRQMCDYVSDIQSNHSTPVAAELEQMNERAEKILQDAKRAGELMESLQIHDSSPSASKASQKQPNRPANIQSDDSNKPSWRRSKYDIERDQAGNAAKRQRVSEHPNLCMPAFPPVLPPFPSGMLRSFQSTRPSWQQNLSPGETKDDRSMQNRIIVANIPLEVHGEELRKHFESVGPVTLKHGLRLPRLAETKIHGLSGDSKKRNMATLDLSDYQAANTAASQLNGTRIKSHHTDPILVRHFCAQTTTPTAGSKRRSSSDANNGSPQTCPQSKRLTRSPDFVKASQSAKPPTKSTPEHLTSSPAPTAQQPKKRHADTVPMCVEASNVTEPTSSPAETSAPKPGKKARLNEPMNAETRTQSPPMTELSATDSPSKDANQQKQHQQPQEDEHQTTTPADAGDFHPAYASSAQLALRSEFDDISNEVGRRLAEAHARRALASKAVAAKARAGRKRKRSSFMSQATEEDDETGDVKKDGGEGEQRREQQEQEPGDEPLAKRSKKEDEKDATKAKRRRSGQDGGAEAAAASAAKSSKADRRQKRRERMMGAPGGASAGGEYQNETANSSPRASKHARRSSAKADCMQS